MGNEFRVTYKNKDIMDKLSLIHEDIGELKTAQAVINGKVKIHQKLLWALGGIIVTIVIVIINLHT